MLCLGGVDHGVPPCWAGVLMFCCWLVWLDRLRSGRLSLSCGCRCWLQAVCASSEDGSCSPWSCVNTACLNGSMLAASQNVLCAVRESRPSVCSVMPRSSTC